MAWSNAKPINNRERKPRLDEEIELYEFPAGKFVQVRYVGPFTSYSQGWIRIKNPKRDSGKKYLLFPKVCLDYNPETQTFEGERCPYRKGGVYMPQRFLTNMIVRDLQEDKPRKMRAPTGREAKPRNMLGEKWRIKEMGSKTWTPVRGHDMPSSLADKLANLSELNTRRKNGKKIAYDITDPRYGMDVLIKYNPKKAGTDKWEVQRAEPTRLSREERDYLIYNLEGLQALKPEDRKTARKEWSRIEKYFAPEKRDNKGSNRGSGRGDRDRNNDRDDRRSGRRRTSERRDTKKERRRERNSGGNNKRRANDRRRRHDFDELDDLD